MVGQTVYFKGAGAITGQGFRIEFERYRPGPYEAMRDEGVAVRGASVEAVWRTTEEVKEKIRDYMDAHFTGSEFHGNGRRRASNAAAQSTYYDEVEAKGQYAGLVYSKFGVGGPGGFVDYLLLHVRGGTLKPRRGDWLRIPNVANGGLAANQTGFFAFSKSDIFFRQSKDGKKLFQFRRYRKGSPFRKSGKLQLLATLVKDITFTPRLSGIDTIAQRRPELFEGYFAEALSLRQEGMAQ